MNSYVLRGNIGNKKWTLTFCVATLVTRNKLLLCFVLQHWSQEMNSCHVLCGRRTTVKTLVTRSWFMTRKRMCWCTDGATPPSPCMVSDNTVYLWLSTAHCSIPHSPCWRACLCLLLHSSLMLKSVSLSTAPFLTLHVEERVSVHCFIPHSPCWRVCLCPLLHSSLSVLKSEQPRLSMRGWAELAELKPLHGKHHSSAWIKGFWQTMDAEVPETQMVKKEIWVLAFRPLHFLVQ